MPEPNDHDLIRDTAGRIDTLENKIKGFVPEQCIETRTTLKNIETKQKEMSDNISKLIWAVVLAIIGIGANLIANNIRWDKPGSGQAQAISQPAKK